MAYGLQGSAQIACAVDAATAITNGGGRSSAKLAGVCVTPRCDAPAAGQTAALASRIQTDNPIPRSPCPAGARRPVRAAFAPLPARPRRRSSCSPASARAAMPVRGSSFASPPIPAACLLPFATPRLSSSASTPPRVRRARHPSHHNPISARHARAAFPVSTGSRLRAPHRRRASCDPHVGGRCGGGAPRGARGRARGMRGAGRPCGPASSQRMAAGGRPGAARCVRPRPARGAGGGLQELDGSVPCAEFRANGWIPRMEPCAPGGGPHAVACLEFEHILHGRGGAWCGSRACLRMNMPAAAERRRGEALPRCARERAGSAKTGADGCPCGFRACRSRGAAAERQGRHGRVRGCAGIARRVRKAR